MAKSLAHEWYIGVAEEKKQPTEVGIRTSILLAKQVLRLCDKWEEELNSAESKISDYETASWGMKQAHRNGDRARIRKIRELFSFVND